MAVVSSSELLAGMLGAELLKEGKPIVYRFSSHTFQVIFFLKSSPLIIFLKKIKKLYYIFFCISFSIFIFLLFGWVKKIWQCFSLRINY